METLSPESFKCPWCDASSSTLRGLSVHVRCHPEKTTQDLYDALYHPEGRPTCKCGCGQPTIFLDVGRGYGEWLRGHKMRVRNNWGHNESAREKSVATRRTRFAAGDLKVWNKGETAASNEAVKRNTEGFKAWLTSHPEESVVRSERMKQNRANGIVKSPRGEQHGQWKDGLSSLNQLAHSYVYNAWTRPKMAAGGFRCSKCQADRDLCVHHDKERFSDLLREAAADVGWDRKMHARDFEMKSKVAQRLADIHVERDISGVVLCRECHAQAHEELGEPKEASVIRSRAVW